MLIDGKKYKINKDTIAISEWDKIYCELLKQVINEGEEKPNRTGIDTISDEGIYFKLNVGEAFPILETKKVNIKNALSEMLWIYQAQSNDVNWLKERNNPIWNEWEIGADGYWRAVQMVPDENGKLVKKKIEKYFGKEYAGTIGTAYGWINAKFKRPQYVLEQLKNNPNDRRMVISLWQDEYLKTAVLPSCVWSSEWKVKNGKLNVFVHQRSCDIPLGLPFNVSQYAILLSLFAKVSNLEVGNLNWSIMDAHIYKNQLEGIKLQLKRYDKMLHWEKFIKDHSLSEIEIMYNFLNHKLNSNEDNIDKEDVTEDINILKFLLTKEKPILALADKDDFFAFDNSEDNKDIKVLNYSSLPFIKMPIAK